MHKLKLFILGFAVVIRCAAGVQEKPVLSDTLTITFSDTTYKSAQYYVMTRMISNSKQQTWFDAAGLCEYLTQEQAVADEQLERAEQEYAAAKKESDRVKKWIKDVEKDFRLKCKKEGK